MLKGVAGDDKNNMHGCVKEAMKAARLDARPPVALRARLLAGNQAARIWFKKSGGDLGPPAGFPRLRIQEYCASRGAPPSEPSLPCFFESACGGNQIRPAAATGCVVLTKGLLSLRGDALVFLLCSVPEAIADGGRVAQRRGYSAGEGGRCRSCSAACTTASGAMPSMQARSGLRQRALKQGEQGASFARITTLAPP